MARTIQEIKTVATQRFMASEILAAMYGFTQGESFEREFSKVSLENFIFDIVAFSIWTVEILMDTHKKEVSDTLIQMLPHTARWYRNKALAFRYGYELIPDSDKYDNTGLSQDQIETSEIIKYAAVEEPEDDTRLIVKIATEVAGELNPISKIEQEAFTAYINEVKDAGVRTTVINYQPDILRLSLRIVRDPLVLDADGTHRVNGGKPVEQAIRGFLRALPFNGELRLQELANKLETADGVAIVQIDSAMSKWIDPAVNGYGDFRTIDIRTIPLSGYFKIENYEGIEYVV
ncbi:hypothetical protein HMPREF0765_4147 [Sphingobacterium spiritivorum ATCC 33300]|uniref:Nucleotidyltransferase n=1 Tax=Sphingobacterium spiritivorum ATCC 33300 TaxID=525372 RepID=C2G3J1_SPHSI|nr:hypothetical protein [Sphingobacterium spiritivorum]EEI90196.1 hypothetical protein HMPREF0765_4147 [Sphingobacterium spiritivorum ATCC 33300]QQS95167.1 hypothetical protein I6J03_17555 [Sphingobacterium spiritivorum]